MSVARERRDLAAAYRAGVEGDVLATVIGVRGSSYRKRGGRAIFRERGVVGTISGGCLERDLARRAAFLTREGPRVIRYDTSVEDAEQGGLSLGCGGEIAVLVERLGRSHVALAAIAAAIERDEPAVSATIVSEGRWLGAAVACVGDEVLVDERLPAPIARALEAACAGGGAPAEIELLVERVEPPPRLLVCGADRDAAAVVELATALGWSVTLARPDAHGAPAEALRAVGRPAAGPRVSAVVMTRSLARDRAWLEALLPREDVAYVGLLGPAHRAARVVEGLRLAEAARAKLHAPIGLDLGGEGPHAVALAIVAEIEACRAGRAGGKLRDATLGIEGAR